MRKTFIVVSTCILALAGGCSSMSPQTQVILEDIGQASSLIVPKKDRSVSVPISHHSSSSHHGECHMEGGTKVCHSDSSSSSSSSSFNIGV